MRKQIVSVVLSLSLPFAWGLMHGAFAAEPEAREEPAESAVARPDPEPAEHPAGDVVRASTGHSSRRHLRERVAVMNSFSVKTNEAVRDAVVVGGKADIQGTVEGDLVAVLGAATLGPAAEVKGDVVLVMSVLEADPAAKIHGDRVFVGGGDVSQSPWLRVPQQWFRHGLLYARPLPHQYWWSWAFAVVGVVLYLLIAVLFPRQLETTVASLESQPGQSFLIGILVVLLTAPALILLAFTGVGLLLIPFLPCLMLGVYWLGKAAVCQYAGQQIGRFAGVSHLQKPLVALLAGALLFCLLYPVPVVGLLVWAVTIPLAIGAVWQAVFKRSESPTNGTVAGLARVGVAPAPGATLASGDVTNLALLPRVGFWWRLLATGLDFMLIGFACKAMDITNWFLLFWTAYHIGFWAWRGTTMGGIVCGLQIVRPDGSTLNFSVALLRSLASFFSFIVLGLGFFWAGWTPEKQAWHDKIADTIMVKLPKFTPLYPLTQSSEPAATPGAQPEQGKGVTEHP